MLTARDLKLDHVNALDISFGTNGFKTQLAANSEKVHSIFLVAFAFECNIFMAQP